MILNCTLKVIPETFWTVFKTGQVVNLCRHANIRLLFTFIYIYEKYLDASMEKKELMRRAIALSEQSVAKGGGPFGAVVAKNGEVVAESSNSVTLDNDPTAHAEVNAIRRAAKALGTYDLSGCEIFTSCEPCPMCLGAIYWAHLDKIYYANNRDDAGKVGFDDDFIYTEFSLSPGERHLPSEVLLADEAKKAFEMWMASETRTDY